MLRGAILLLLGLALGLASAQYRDRDQYQPQDNWQQNDNQRLNYDQRRDGITRSYGVNRGRIYCYINDTLLSQARNNYQSTVFGARTMKLELCTHIVFGAVQVNHFGDIKPFNPDRESTSSNTDGLNFHDINNLKNQNPNLKIIISISGEQSAFAEVARSRRPNFLSKLDGFFNQYRFDGVNIDWRWPTITDKENFATLIKELSQKMRQRGSAITVSLPHQVQRIRESYALDDMLDHIDAWFIMAFEYNNHAKHTIGPNAPIHGRHREGVSHTIKEIKNIFRPDRYYSLILMIPFYGKTYTLPTPSDSPLGREFTNRHPLNDAIMSPYRDICSRINGGNWQRGWDSDTETPYAVQDKVAIVYDDPKSITAKVNFALRERLGGVMAYSIDMDDYAGSCSQYRTNQNMNMNQDMRNGNYNNERHQDLNFPLLQAMYEAVKHGGSAGLSSSPLSLAIGVIAAMFYKFLA